MRALPIAFAVALAWSGTVAPAARADSPAAHVSAEPVKKELTTVIDAQLAAFRAGDYTKAYTFAAVGVKEMFSLERFETMVKVGYPLIAESARAEYGLAFDTGEEAVVSLTVENARGERAHYQYTLHKENGAWKITGVTEEKPEGTSV